jgi:hypothetical protein
VELPLEPTRGPSLVEPQALGIVAIATNGVPVYGAQEGGGSNAVAPSAGSMVTDAQYWYGHAAPSKDWHYHHPALGHEGGWGESTLLGYALDGYPIYGALADDASLDACNFDEATQRYHVRTREQVDGDGDYCDGDSPAIRWNYTVGCYVGDLAQTSVKNSGESSLPADCTLVGHNNIEALEALESSESGEEQTEGPGFGTVLAAGLLLGVVGYAAVIGKRKFSAARATPSVGGGSYVQSLPGDLGEEETAAWRQVVSNDVGSRI